MLSSGPALLLRPAAAQLQLLKTGFPPVLWASLSKRAMSPEGFDPCECPFCGFTDQIVSLAHRLAELQPQQRPRLHPNLIQIVACQLALRTAENPPRAIRDEFGLTPSKVRHKQFAIKLENLRKRSKRKFQSAFGAETYRSFQKDWAAYLDCLREKLSGRWPRCLRQRKRTTPRANTLLIDGLVRSVMPHLRRRKKSRDHHEIRRLVRLFLRYIRLGRLNINIHDCHRALHVVTPQLAVFIQRRL